MHVHKINTYIILLLIWRLYYVSYIIIITIKTFKGMVSGGCFLSSKEFMV